MHVGLVAKGILNPMMWLDSDFEVKSKDLLLELTMCLH